MPTQQLRATPFHPIAVARLAIRAATRAVAVGAHRAAVEARNTWRSGRGGRVLVLIDLDACGIRADSLPRAVDAIHGAVGDHAELVAAGHQRSSRAHATACRRLGVQVLHAGEARNAADAALIGYARRAAREGVNTMHVVTSDGDFCALPGELVLLTFVPLTQVSKRLRARVARAVQLTTDPDTERRRAPVNNALPLLRTG